MRNTFPRCEAPAPAGAAARGDTIPCDLPAGHPGHHHWRNPDPLGRVPQTYTAVGFWQDGEVEICGSILGEHNVIGGDSVTEEGPWAGHFTTYETDPEKIHEAALACAAGASPTGE